MARVLLLSVFFVLICGVSIAVSKLSPVEIRPGQTCKECGMSILAPNLKFASEEVNPDGKVEVFCDIGDLLTHYEFEGKKGQAAEIYVKDYLSGAWVPGREAYYLTKSTVVTPMRYGILAFKDYASAEKFKRENGGGGIYNFEGVLASKVYRR